MVVAELGEPHRMVPEVAMVIFESFTFFLGEVIELISSAESPRGIDLLAVNGSNASNSLLSSSLLVAKSRVILPIKLSLVE